jgi:hypothetical protein
MSASTAAPFGEHFAHEAFGCEIHMGGTAKDRFVPLIGQRSARLSIAAG